MSKDITVTDEEYQEHLTFIRKWALKKIDKYFRKMKRYASLYHGEEVFLVCYTKDKTGRIHIMKGDE